MGYDGGGFHSRSVLPAPGDGHLGCTTGGGDPGDAGREVAEVVGVDAVGLLDAQRPQAGGADLVELMGPFGPLHRSGPGGDGFGVGEAVGDDGGRGAEEPFPFAGVVVEPFDALGGDDHAAVEAAEPFEQRGGVARPQRGELVDDEERFAVRSFSSGGVVLEVLEEVAGETGGVVAEGDAVEEDVAGPGVLEGPVTGELLPHCSAEGPIAGEGAFADLVVDVEVAVGEARHQLLERAWLPAGGVVEEDAGAVLVVGLGVVDDSASRLRRAVGSPRQPS